MGERNDIKEVTIPLDGVSHLGDLGMPSAACGLVLFAHGSGSSRLSPRNRYVAEVLRGRTIGSLLFDLLTEREDVDDERRFDIRLLTHRLLGATDWVSKQRALAGIPLGYFGASTGAAAALHAAAARRGKIHVVVSRGGRPDLAEEALSSVQAPTLLIVGGQDEAVIEMNERAFRLLRCEKRLEIVSGATHLFEEPGTLEQVAALASRWFKAHFPAKEVA